MFYRKEDVDEAILCGICHNVYKNPRVLPCSESACHECIQFMIQTDPNQEFDCMYCHEKHTPLGKDGFPLNGALIKLLKAKAGNVCRSAKVEELKDKLVDIKRKCEKFQLSLDNGIDLVRNHCIRLRNQVHLETDILIEEAHNINESLIAEIDRYEQECVDSFNSNMENKNENADELMVELNDFHSDKTKYLTEFKIDEKLIEETITKADSHLEKLKVEDELFNNTLFNGKEVEFRKSPNKIDRALLGTLVYKSLKLNVANLNEAKFANNIITNYYSSIHFFKHSDGNNFAFYINTNHNLSMTKFDNIGNVVKKVSSAFNHGGHKAYSQIFKLEVSKSLDNFIFYARLAGFANGTICGHRMFNDQGIIGLFFILDQDLNYIKHNSDFYNQQFLHMAANSSRVICIDLSYKYNYLDLNLHLVNDKPLNEIANQVGNKIVEVQISDKYVFFLCKYKKMKIFEIESGDLVKEVDTSANHIKLAPDDHIVLFDSINRKFDLYEQTGKFCNIDEANLDQSLESGFTINRDSSSTLVFCNSTCMTSASLD